MEKEIIRRKETDPETVGGQAVLEGVMMRSPHAYVVAVRSPEGEIVLERQVVRGLGARFPILKKPFLRGLIILAESLYYGMKGLFFSGNIMAAEEDQKEISKWYFVLIAIVSLALGLVLFLALPLLGTKWLAGIFSVIDSSNSLFNLVDGIIRMSALLLYIWLISFMADMRRVYQYHGAEHQSIFAYEAGLPLTVENTESFTTYHPRCGTSFLLIVILVSVFAFTMIPKDLPFFMNLGLRFCFLPLIAGVSYEMVRFTGKNLDKKWVRCLAAPGLWVQRITTKPPSQDQLEVGLASIRAAIELERAWQAGLVDVGKVTVEPKTE